MVSGSKQSHVRCKVIYNPLCALLRLQDGSGKGAGLDTAANGEAEDVPLVEREGGDSADTSGAVPLSPSRRP